jgi:hypothetical protein
MKVALVLLGMEKLIVKMIMLGEYQKNEKKNIVIKYQATPSSSKISIILFHRLFGTKCDKCGNSFSKNDFVMRAKSKIYHIECFRCSACARQLIPGK